MGEPVSLLGQARAFAQDFPRDQMPPGYLWDVVDFVPAIIDASLTGRGGWTYGSVDVGSPIESGIYATFLAGDQLLIQTTAGALYNVAANGTVTSRGSVPRARQNPVQLFDTVVHFDTTRAVVPKLITSSAITASDASAPKAAVGTIWRNTVAADGGPGNEDEVHFGTPGQPTAAWDAASFQGTSGAITALGAIRSVLLVFHAGSVEKIRGDEIPSLAGDVTGNLSIEPLSTDVGCSNPLTITTWGDNLIFADEHGVHMTDGAVIRNIVSQGGITSFWRTLWGQRIGPVVANTFLDYYVLTIRTASAPVTLVCDLTRRQWFRFSNINSGCYITSAGGSGPESIWSGLVGSNRLALISPCFFPDLYTAIAVADANAVIVAPVFETPWYRLAKEGRKRIRFAYLSYDARAAPSAEVLDLGYIRSPPDINYISLGQFPNTNQYRRYRLPLGKAPYGVAFRVRQVAATTALRVYDLAVEAGAMERSRV